MSDVAELPYDVGYGKPPQHSRFKKGQSGNPKGRPKGAKGFKSIVRQVMTEKIPIRTASGKKRVSKLEAMLHKTNELAFGGNLRALSFALGLYRDNVPEELVPAALSSPDDTAMVELDETDLAILAAYNARLFAEREEGS